MPGSPGNRYLDPLGYFIRVNFIYMGNNAYKIDSIHLDNQMNNLVLVVFSAISAPELT